MAILVQNSGISLINRPILDAEFTRPQLFQKIMPGQYLQSGFKRPEMFLRGTLGKSIEILVYKEIKSCLCQENLYLLELVRYIHLNPLRAGIVKELKELDKYPYCGHSVLMGENKREWQDVDYILKFCDSKYLTARRRCREYVKKGFADGRRPELVGGGLVRSAGGWSVVKAMRRGFERMKGDERILGEGDLFETVLKAAQENLDRKAQLEAAGYSFDWLARRVARQLEIEPKDVLAPGKYAQSVKVRSLLCYWGTRELVMTTIDPARRLNLAQPTVSQAVMRGQKIVEDQGLCLID